MFKRKDGRKSVKVTTGRPSNSEAVMPLPPPEEKKPEESGRGRGLSIFRKSSRGKPSASSEMKTGKEAPQAASSKGESSTSSVSGMALPNPTPIEGIVPDESDFHNEDKIKVASSSHSSNVTTVQESNVVLCHESVDSPDVILSSGYVESSDRNPPHTSKQGDHRSTSYLARLADSSVESVKRDGSPPLHAGGICKKVKVADPSTEPEREATSSNMPTTSLKSSGSSSGSSIKVLRVVEKQSDVNPPLRSVPLFEETPQVRDIDSPEINLLTTMVLADSWDMKLAFEDCKRICEIEDGILLNPIQVLVTRTYNPLVHALLKRKPSDNQDHYVLYGKNHHDKLSEIEQEHLLKHREEIRRTCKLQVNYGMLPGSRFSIYHLEHTNDFSSESVQDEIVSMMFQTTEDVKQRLMARLPEEIRLSVTAMYEKKLLWIQTTIDEYVKKKENEEKKIRSVRPVTIINANQLDGDLRLVPNSDMEILIFDSVILEEKTVYKFYGFEVQKKGIRTVLVSAADYKIEKVKTLESMQDELERKLLTINTYKNFMRENQPLHGRIDIQGIILKVGKGNSLPQAREAYDVLFGESQEKSFNIKLHGVPLEMGYQHILRSGKQVIVRNLDVSSPDGVIHADHLTEFLSAEEERKLRVRENKIDSNLETRFCTVEFLPTGLKGLDRILGGGLCLGQITHFFGKTCSCKTMICHFITYHLCHSSITPSYVLYIDTKNDFSPSLMAKLCEENIESLKRILIYKVFDFEALLETLIKLANKFKDGSDPRLKLAKLLVIDCVPMVVYPAIQDRSSWRAVPEKLFNHLNMVAKTLNISIILVNHAVKLRSRQMEVKPALGWYYELKSKTRIYLSPDSTTQGLYSAVVSKSSRGNVGERFSFRVKNKRILEIDD